jgi:hypothetical protein
LAGWQWAWSKPFNHRAWQDRGRLEFSPYALSKARVAQRTAWPGEPLITRHSLALRKKTSPRFVQEQAWTKWNSKGEALYYPEGIS